MDAEQAVKLSENAYRQSTQWIDTNLRKEWEANLRQYQGRHPLGSKYLSDDYKFRSKHFRPKTKAAIQGNLADCAFAFFSTNRLADIRPANDADPVQRAAADIAQQLLHHRLTVTIPWLLVVLGGYQDAQVTGVAVAHPYWDYQERVKDLTSTTVDESGMEVPLTAQVKEVLRDRPWVDLLPVENFRASPSADWLDPVNSSPYFIRMIPMYAMDVMAKMGSEWKDYTLEQIQAASESSIDITRKVREKDQQDRYEEGDKSIGEFDTVWVHQNFIRDGYDDWVFYTVGSSLLLSEPVLVQEKYPHLRKGERPFVWGFCDFAAHTVYQDGIAALLREPQRELNDMVNLRMDAVKQNVAGRYLVKRTANVDYESLRKNIPGSGTLVDNPAADVQLLQQKPVDASSFQEEDRLQAAFDDLSGAFALSSVNTNRNLNQTVGGMNILSAASSKIADFRILVYAKSFVEKIISQIIRLESEYESDQALLALCGQKAQLGPRYGINNVTDELLRQELFTTVNVGISSTNPVNRMNMFTAFLSSIAQLVGPEMAAQIFNLKEIVPEAAGIMGYQDGMRFFNSNEAGDDPRIPQLMGMVQQLQQAIQTKQVEEQSRNDRMQLLQDKKDYAALMRERMKADASLREKMLEIGHDHAMTEHQGMVDAALTEMNSAEQ